MNRMTNILRTLPTTTPSLSTQYSTIKDSYSVINTNQLVKASNVGQLIQTRAGKHDPIPLCFLPPPPSFPLHPIIHLPQHHSKLLIIGDVHGCVEEMEEIVEKSGIDKKKVCIIQSIYSNAAYSLTLIVVLYSLSLGSGNIYR